MSEKWAVPAQAGTIGLMGHVIADYPDPRTVREMIGIMAAAGVSLIEIQIPFSEPMADGPVFMKANHEALARGTGVQQAFQLMSDAARAYPGIGLLFMTYLNPVYRMGYGTFAREAVRVGARAVIVPDLPYECCTPLETELARHGLANVRLVAPNADEHRLQTVLSGCDGLVYAVARSGVTGAGTVVGDDVQSFADRVRRISAAPVAVGFGISTPEDIRRLKGHADYAVVGTAALRAMQQQGLAGFREFWDGICQAARSLF